MMTGVPYLVIKGFIQVISLMIVKSVIRPFLIEKPWITIKEYMMVRNLILVTYARNHFLKVQIFLNIVKHLLTLKERRI